MPNTSLNEAMVSQRADRPWAQGDDPALIEPKSRHIIVSPHNCSEASMKRALGAWAVHPGPIQRRNSNAMSTAYEMA